MELILSALGLLSRIFFGVSNFLQLKKYPGKLLFITKSNFNIFTTTSSISGKGFEITYKLLDPPYCLKQIAE